MGPLVVVMVQIGIEVSLHLLDRFVSSRATRNVEVLVQQGAVQPFDEAIALRSPDMDRAMLVAFQLQEQFEWMLIGPAAILPAIVRE